MKIDVNVVNSFTVDGNGGNPAGVVFEADSLSESQMMNIAKVAGFAETAFVSKSNEATHKVRFFTPTDEVDLCGHATIATWSLMLEKGIHTPGTYTQEIPAGNLQVQIEEGGLVFMEQAEPAFFDVVDFRELAPILGIQVSDFNSSLRPQVVSTGLRDLLVAVRDENVLANLKPDLEAITTLSERLNLIAVHVFALTPQTRALAVARNFSPRVGIDEESATGSSNGAVLCYLRKYSALPKQTTYLIEQGVSMGQLSHIYGQFRGDRVWVGGKATLVSHSEVEI